MAASAEIPSDARPFLIDNDSETFVHLILMDKDVTDRLDDLFARIRQDPIDTSPWTEWEKQCRENRISVPETSKFSVEKPQISHKIPGSFDTPAGKNHLKAVQAVLNVEEASAVQITLSCMYGAPSVDATQDIYGSHALFEKVVDYAYDQQVARIRVLGEALRAEKDDSTVRYHQPMTRLLDELDQKSKTQDGENRGIFQLLVLIACRTDTDLTRPQILPARELWTQNPRGKREESAKDDEWKALGRRIVIRQQRFIQEARKEALEALLVLLYHRMIMKRADYAVLLMALRAHGFFAGDEEKFPKRLGHLAGLACVEACRLCEIQAENHSFMGDEDPTALNERSALCRMLEVEAYADNNRPQGLALLAYGCMLYLGGQDEGHKLALLSVNQCQADLYLEETMNYMVEKPIIEQRVINTRWFEEYGKILEANQETNFIETEMNAPSMLYAYVGSELLVALLNTFKDLLLDPQRSSFPENLNAMANLVKAVHCNSAGLGGNTWREWSDYKFQNGERGPISHVIELSCDLAAYCLNSTGRLDPVKFLQGVSPILKIASALVYSPESLYIMVVELLPPSLIYSSLLACQSTLNTDEMQIWRAEVLESIRLLVSLAQTSECRSILRGSLDPTTVPGGPLGPQELFQIARASGSYQSLSSVAMIVADLLPGAPTQWFLQTLLGLNAIQLEARGNGGILGRHKASTEALVHLTHTLVLHMNSVFYAEIEEDKMLQALNSISAALFSIVEVLISSTSALSGSMFDGKPLPLETAAKILVTLGNSITMLRMLEWTHESERVSCNALGTIDSLVRLASKKSSAGDSILYFATLPAALSIASDLQNIIRNASLASAVHSASSFFGSSRPTGQSIDLHGTLVARMSNISQISIDLDALEAEGWLWPDTAKGVREVSAAALRFLFVMFDHLNYTGNDPRDPSCVDPYELLVSRASPSYRLRRSSDLARAWSSSGITYIELFIRQLHMKDMEECISLPAFALFGNYMEHGSHDFEQGVRSSSSFRELVQSTFEDLNEQTKSKLSSGIKGGKSLAASLRCLKQCFDFDIDVIDHDKENDKWANLIECVVTYSKEGMKTHDDVIVCSECLRLLLTVRMEQHGCSDKTCFSVEQSFLFAVASFATKQVFDSSLYTNEMSDSVAVQRTAKSYLVCTALEFLCFEMERTQSQPRSAAHSVFSALEGVLGSGNSGLLRWAENALLVSALPVFIDDFLLSRSSAGRIKHFPLEVLSNLLLLFNSNASFPSSDGLPLWLSSLENAGLISNQFALGVYRLHALYSFLQQEMARTLCARSFLFMLSRDRRHRILSGGFFGSMTRTVITCMDKNFRSVSSVSSLIGVYTLVEKMSKISEQSASFLVLLVSDEENHKDGLQGGNDDDVIQLLRIVPRIQDRALSHFKEKRQHCLVAQKLLVASTQLTARAPEFDTSNSGGASSGRRSMLQKIQIELARIACVVLKRLVDPYQTLVWEGGVEDVKEMSECFRSCVSFLCGICEFTRTTEEPKNFLDNFSGVLASTHVRDSLINSIIESENRKRIGRDGILAVFCLFQAMATLNDKEMLSKLFEAGGILQFLRINFVSQTSTAVVAGVAMRGYVSLRSGPPRWSPRIDPHQSSNISLQIGQDDDDHEIRVGGTAFVAAALRAIAVTEFNADHYSRNIRSAALDYVGSCGSDLLDCLKQVGEISFNPEVSNLTMRSLREASITLSLIAECCRQNNVDEFMRRHPGLYASFEAAARAVARSMCSFLGSSGYSRELFRALGDDDNGTQGDGSRLGLSPLRDLLSRGLLNEKHEAIRFSHFVSRCSAAVTEKEHEQQNQYPEAWASAHRRASVDDPHSESTFERKSKGAVTNLFAFRLEEEGSRCLFHALDVLWKTRQRKMSPIGFSQQELQSLQLWDYVGATIIFQSDSQAHRGQIKKVDTVSRVWKVSLLGAGNDDELCAVPIAHTIAIQSESQRRPAINFSAAPENSTELEQLGSSLSTGHLILALRWCHEYSFEVGDRNLTSNLAEITSFLLGTEVSLSREAWQRNNNMPPPTSELIEMQFLDLFGLEEELCKGLDSDGAAEASGNIRREGRLHGLLPDESLQAVRGMIKPELEKAVHNVQTRREKKRARSSGEGLFMGSYRRSPSSRSPFRQLSF